jgi:hypothetical protein
MNEEGLYLVDEDGEAIPVHTSGCDDDEELLQEYLEEWDLK